MNVTGYSRVSTEEQAREGLSLEVQKIKIQQYCQLFDLRLVAECEDPGLSAKSLDRPGLQYALGCLRDGSADGLVVLKLDRLTRSVADLELLLTEYFEERYKLISLNEQIDTRTAGGKLMLRLLGVVSQWERETIGERTAIALQHKKSQGQQLGGHGFGWRLIDGKRVPVEAEQVIIKKMRAMRRQGKSLQAIADWANESGVRSLRGGKWYPKSISNIIE
ncbi:recombinase family protein [Laspinema olomoucense]|uniref:recombinase family protein n=1 Tax=Laspinema olomoucense TaxID=3231600 RepID=UPI0021BA6799|nr:recombinase family protein [Laspinema sp. D3d]MCT7971095.1 recombinase family protein [Laspinema sp. D3d]